MLSLTSIFVLLETNIAQVVLLHILTRDFAKTRLISGSGSAVVEA